MAYKNRFHKTTLGVDADVLVAKAVEYTDDATFVLFVANSVEGELALVKTADMSIPDGSAALAAGTEVFFALKRDGNIEKSLPFKVGTATITKAPYVAPVKHAITIVTTSYTPVKGDYVEVAVIETTPGMQPLPTYSYGIEAKAGETFTQLMVRLVALVNNSTAIENQDKTPVVSAAIASTDDIVLTAVRFNEHFTVALRGKMADVATFSVTSQFKLGSGTPEQVLIAEEEGDIRRGVTTNYPEQNATPAEFGKPTSFVVSTLQYEAVVIKHFTEDVTRTLDTEKRKNYTFLYVPSNGTADASAEVNTMLGL